VNYSKILFSSLDIGLFTVESLRDAITAQLPRATQDNNGDEKADEKADGMMQYVIIKLRHTLYNCTVLNLIATDETVVALFDASSSKTQEFIVKSYLGKNQNASIKAASKSNRGQLWIRIRRSNKLRWDNHHHSISFLNDIIILRTMRRVFFCSIARFFDFL